jgi:mRNA deadenylase 3'-5' endonuclease subunit Ccr4
LCLPTAFNYIQFNTSNKLKQSNQIKITSYNSMLFDLYQWKKNKGNRMKILNNLAEINPDILCLQEFFTSEENNNFNNIIRLSI